MKHKVIVDCDNTFGVPGKPIDDGQAILYLLGRDDVEIVGITTTFGNSSIDDVHDATVWLMDQIGRHDIPVLRGASGHDGEPTDASRFLLESAAAHEGEISIIAIGTLANLKSAQRAHSGFFGALKQIVTMGGYFHRLPYKGWADVGEVNFSGDGEATWMVFRAECPVVVMDANICFALPFGLAELAPVAAFDRRQYFIMKELLLNSAGHLGEAQDYLWDLLPALYISYPDLFHHRVINIPSSPEEIEEGYLRSGDSGPSVVVPDYVTDVDRCYSILYEAWSKTRFDPRGPWFSDFRRPA